jgi:1-acyl-sn-glycerol-3-phosphate acyltransferase
MTEAQPPLEFIPQKFSPLVLKCIQVILPYWLDFKTNIAKIEGDNIENIVKLWQQFQAGKIRLMLAFRHPSVNDPIVLAHLFWKLLPQTAKQQKIELKHPIHSHFIYDRGIPLWAGNIVGWLYSRLGGTPIQRGKLDLVGLRSARELFANSIFPIAAAPEGATNGHNELVSPLEPGIAQLGFWCGEDLKKNNDDRQVFILPIGIQYQYINPPWQQLDRLLNQLEIDCGLAAGEDRHLGDRESQNIDILYQRLYHLGEHLLGVMEKFYHDFYHRQIESISTELSSDNNRLGLRLQNLLGVALQVAEEYFNLSPKGTKIDRCRRLEQAGWDYIYRGEFKDITKISAIEKGLGDRLAIEAEMRMWHMRIVESFVAVTGHYVKEKPTVERFAETALLLWDLIERIKGNNPNNKPNLGNQKVSISIGEAINVSDRSVDYKANRKKSVDRLTQDLQIALESLIVSQ